jgi:hypothetical protein
MCPKTIRQRGNKGEKSMKKKHWLVLVFVWVMVALFCSMADAAPFWTFDPNPGVTVYKLTGPAWVPASVTAQADGSLKLDVGAAAVGTSNLTSQACSVDPIWGEQCNAALPFSFTRPAKPAASTGGKLVP